ncbi:Carbonic anhydrase [uncultured archaeon]|nr:Carbonic anhydrase [uncultured archaeon]
MCMLKKIVLFTERGAGAARRITRALGALDIPVETVGETTLQGKPAVVLAVLSRHYRKAKKAIAAQGLGLEHAKPVERGSNVILGNFGSRRKSKIDVYFPSSLANIQDGRRKEMQKERHSAQEISQALQERNLASIKERGCVHITACMDPRINLPEIFGASSGQIYESKNAGNIVHPNIIEDIKTAVAHGARVIGIFGHTDCKKMRSDAHAQRNLEEQFEKLANEPEISRWVQEGKVALVGGMYVIRNEDEPRRNFIQWHGQG